MACPYLPQERPCGIKAVNVRQSPFSHLVPLPSISKPEETFRKAWLTPWMAISPLELTDKNIELHPACVDSLTVINEYGVQKSAFPVSETLGRSSADLKAVREEIHIDCHCSCVRKEYNV